MCYLADKSSSFHVAINPGIGYQKQTKKKKKEKTNNKKIAKVLELLLYANDIVFLKMKRNNRNG